MRTLASNWLRLAVRSASAVVSSEKVRSAAASVASASATRSSVPLRLSTRDLISSLSTPSSDSSRASATSASDSCRCSRSMSAANCVRRRSSSVTRSLARASSRSSISRALVSRCKPAAGAGFVLAQARQFGGADRLNARGFRLLAGAFGLFADIQVVGFACVGDVGMRLQPAQVETAWPRPCGPWRRLRGSGLPDVPAFSGRRSGRPTGR